MILDCEGLITLITSTVDYDDIGVATTKETRRMAYAQLSSIGQSEYWSSAAQHDIKPEGRAKVFYFDYNGEETVEYEDVRYSVYRSYKEGDYITLYLQKTVRDV